MNIFNVSYLHLSSSLMAVYYWLELISSQTIRRITSANFLNIRSDRSAIPASFLRKIRGDLKYPTMSGRQEGGEVILVFKLPSCSIGSRLKIL